MFDSLFIYLVLILVPGFLASFSALFCLQMMCATECGFRLNRSQIFRILLHCCLSAPSQKKVFKRQNHKKIFSQVLQLETFLCEGALRHRNTRE